MERFTASERGDQTESRLPSSADLFALGVVMATAAVVLIEVRFFEDWPRGALLALAGGAAVAVYGIAARGGRPAQAPEPYRSALLLSSLVLVAVALINVAELLAGDDEPGEWTLVWSTGAFVAIAALTGVVFRSAACTLVAALTAAATTLAVVASAVEPEDPVGYQWTVAAYFGALCAAAYVLSWLGERRHAPQLATAAAIALIAASYGFEFLFFDFEDGDYTDGPGRGLEALLILGPFLVVAYGLLFRERGPAWAGGIALALGVFIVQGKATLVVWPLALLGGAAVLMIAAAVRRTRA